MMEQRSTTQAQRLPGRRRAGGFTLIEILIAFGIFAIGMIALASLFPVAALLQRQTASEVISEHAAQSAAAIVEAKGLTYAVPADRPGRSGDLDNYHNISRTSVVPLHQLSPANNDQNLLNGKFSLGDRSYPTSSPTPADSDLFWVPFVRDLNGDPDQPDFVLHLFILEPDSNVFYPGTGTAANPYDGEDVPRVIPVDCSVTADGKTFVLNGFNTNNRRRRIEGGDKIMDSNGTDYTVAEVNGNRVTIIGRILKSPNDPDQIWYAPPYTGSSSPARRIVTVKIDHQTPTP